MSTSYLKQEKDSCVPGENTVFLDPFTHSHHLRTCRFAHYVDYLQIDDYKLIY